MENNIDRMKYLFEYHFKGMENGNGANEGLKNDFPTYEEYKEEIIDEDGEEEKEEVAPAEQPATEEPTPEQPTIEPETEEPVETGTEEPVVEPEPEQPSEDEQLFNKLEGQINDQNSKIDQILNSIGNLNQAINPQAEPETTEDKILAKLETLEKTVEDIKNPNKFNNDVNQNNPFNIKLSDYWKNEEKNEEPEEFTISQSDVDNYNKGEIEKSLGLNERHQYLEETTEVVNSEEISEAVDTEIYHDTFSSAVQLAKQKAEDKGYIVDEDDWFSKVNSGDGKPSVGQTTKVSLGLLKNGKETTEKLHIQVYGMEEGKYELNYYIN